MKKKNLTVDDLTNDPALRQHLQDAVLTELAKDSAWSQAQAQQERNYADLQLLRSVADDLGLPISGFRLTYDVRWLAETLFVQVDDAWHTLLLLPDGWQEDSRLRQWIEDAWRAHQWQSFPALVPFGSSYLPPPPRGIAPSTVLGGNPSPQPRNSVDPMPDWLDEHFRVRDYLSCPVCFGVAGKVDCPLCGGSGRTEDEPADAVN